MNNTSLSLAAIDILETAYREKNISELRRFIGNELWLLDDNQYGEDFCRGVKELVEAESMCRGELFEHTLTMKERLTGYLSPTAFYGQVG